MAGGRVGGTVSLQANGRSIALKGPLEILPGIPTREPIIGADGQIHGYSEKWTAPMMKGATTDSAELDTLELLTLTDATITASLPNGKVGVIRGAWQMGDGSRTTEEGEVKLEFSGLSYEEFRP